MSVELAQRLAAVGAQVRDAVGAGPTGDRDRAVVRVEGGDEIFGVDERAETVLVSGLRDACAHDFPGTLVLEGFAEPVAIGDERGPWRYIADPVDGSRPWLAGKRSAWVLIGAGRDAATLADLEVSACVELPTARTAGALVACASRGDGAVATDGRRSVPLRPQADAILDRRFVSVQRFAPGEKARIAAWEDELLSGLETYEDPYLCSGGQLMEVALGREAAVLDPRPLLSRGLAAHPYDLAGWLVAAEAGVIVEALPPGPLAYPLDTSTPCAWAAYANAAIADQLRARLPAVPS